MIVKSYKKQDTEFVITMQANDQYRVIRMVKGQEPDLTPIMGYECASEVFDFFMDMETGVDK